MKLIEFAGIIGVALFASASAWAAGGHGAHEPGAARAMSAAAGLADAEVKKVDRAQGKITLKHGPIESLGMPGMTMVFRVQEPAMLDHVNPGDKVRFEAEKKNGALTVTRLEIPK